MKLIIMFLLTFLFIAVTIIFVVPFLGMLGILPNTPSGAMAHAETIMKSKGGVIFTEKTIGDSCCGVKYYYLHAGDETYITHDFWLFRKASLNKEYRIDYTDVNFLHLWRIYEAHP